MKLKNNGGSFTVIFTGKDYVVPSGEFEVFSDPLGYFILNRASKWNKDVVSVGVARTDEIRANAIVPAITPITKPAKLTEPTEPFIESKNIASLGATRTETKAEVKVRKEAEAQAIK